MASSRSVSRLLKLNTEATSVGYGPSALLTQSRDLDCTCGTILAPIVDFNTEVSREECRRAWWLLFLMDQHLALCYNQPESLLEAECQDLLLTLVDVVWQSSLQPHSKGASVDGPQCMSLQSGAGRPQGPPITYTSPGIFGFFLPLMSITGHLLDYHRMKIHPPIAASAPLWLNPKGNRSQQSLIDINAAWCILETHRHTSTRWGAVLLRKSFKMRSRSTYTLSISHQGMHAISCQF